MGRSLMFHHLTNYASSRSRGLCVSLGQTQTELLQLPCDFTVRRYSKGKKTLECILTSDIDKVGTAGETVKVAPGYFRNHLMPKSLALPNLNKYAQLIAEQNKIYQRPKEEKKVEVVQRSEEQQMDEFKTAVRRLSNGRLGLRRLVLNYGKELRYPVTKEEILDEVRRQLQVSLEKENLIMPENLTMCGEYELPLRLPKVIPLVDGNTNILLKVKIQRK
ncbi:uncharacterized protein LOC131044362 [Cryptomeria japonica]|uniref:uncharacterized protein LOC131044362 n=1 Tax=Cryptomeria japonica TaxID=3369 RepID=UPI0025AD2E4F|nr:uncharacterized protein LOC131044362 [Cryptomeria japonica]